jgi:hypothetical protein
MGGGARRLSASSAGRYCPVSAEQRVGDRRSSGPGLALGPGEAINALSSGVFTNLPFNLAIKQAHPGERRRPGDLRRCRAGRLVSPGWKDAFAVAGALLGELARSRLGGPASALARKGGGPELQTCTSPRPRTGCRPDVDEILGLIAAARSAGPMPGGRSREQLRDLSQISTTVQKIIGCHCINISRAK